MSENKRSVFSRNDLWKKAVKHFNEPVMYLLGVCRLVGYTEGDDDCYWILDHPRRGKFYASCVGGLTFLGCLKNTGVTIPKHPSFEGEVWNDFTRIESLLHYAGCVKSELFLTSIE